MKFFLSFPQDFPYVLIGRNRSNDPYLYWGGRQNQALFPWNPLTSVHIMNSATKELIEIFARTNNHQEMEVLFREIFTPSEIATLTLRWELLKDLYEGKTQRKIAAEHKISLCKITRGSKLLKARGSYLKKVLDQLYSADSAE
jgi:TrpR family trp operon transcriptional repressor